MNVGASVEGTGILVLNGAKVPEAASSLKTMLVLTLLKPAF